MATACWLGDQAQRRVRHPSKSPTQNSAYVWVTAGAEDDTVVWVHNYWSDAYGIPTMTFNASLIDLDGHRIHHWSFVLPTDATLTIDVATVCRMNGIPMPFEGQLLLEASHDRLVDRRPIQVFAEYRHGDGNWTGVHGQYGNQVRPLAQGIAEMRIEAGPEARSAVVLVNSYDGPGAPRPLSATIEVRDAEGRARRAPVAAVAPRATRMLWLDDLFPDLAGFLAGRPGSLAVALPCPASRLLNLVQYGDGRRIVDHGTVDARVSQQRGSPVGWTDGRYVASCLSLCDDTRDTTLTLINTWGPVPGEHRAALRFSSTSGEELARHEEVVPEGGCITLSAREVLARHCSSVPSVAHVEMTVHPIGEADELPVLFNVVVGLVDDGRLIGEELVGGAYFNASPPPGSGFPDIRRTRIFTRVCSDQAARTWIWLGHPVGGNEYDVVSRPSVTLIDPAGERRASAQLELPPHGCVFFDVAELFPEASALLGPGGAGALRIRATDARLVGSHLVERTGSRTVALDHLVGG